MIEGEDLADRPFLGLAALVVGVGAALRLVRLGAWSLWLDEGMTWQRATTGVLDDQGPLYVATPLNYLLTRAVVVSLGDAPLWLRIVPAVFGVAGVAAVIWAGRRIGGPVCGLVAGAFVALSPWHLQWSRHFSAVFLFTTIAFGAAYAYLEEGRRRHLITSALAGALGLAAHSSAAFVLVAIAGTAVWRLTPAGHARAGAHAHARARSRALRLAILLVGTGLAYAPVALWISAYLAGSREAWNTPGNVLASIAYYIGPAPLAIVALAAATGARRGDPVLVAVGAWLAVPAALAVAAASVTISSGAYAIASLAAVAVGAGLVVAALAPVRVAAIGSAGGLLLAALVADQATRSVLYLTAEAGNRPPWHDAADWVGANVPAGAPVYSDAAVVLRYYLGPERDLRWLDSWAPAERDAHWLVILADAPARSSPAVRAHVGADCALETVFRRSGGPKRRDVEVYRCAASVGEPAG